MGQSEKAEEYMEFNINEFVFIWIISLADDDNKIY